MSWQFNPYAIPLLSSSVLLVLFAIIARQRSPGRPVRLFLVFMLSVAGLNTAYALELLSADLSTILFWAKAQFLFTYLPVLWLFFVLAYTGNGRWLTRGNFARVYLLPAAWTVMVWTNDYHHLNWTTVGTEQIGSLVLFDRTYGPAFFIGIGSIYVITLLAAVVMVVSVVRSPAIYRGQIHWLLLGAALPLMGSFLTIAGLVPFPKLDLMPFGYVLGCVPLGWSMFRYRLFDIIPTAFSEVITSMEDGVFVLDAQKRILNLNPAALRLLQHDSRDSLIGESICDLFHSRMTDEKLCLDVPAASGELQFRQESGLCYLDYRLSELRDPYGHLRGHVLVLRDITARKQAEAQMAQYMAELENRNQELNAFGHMVAHDLRAPLTIILGFSETTLLLESRGKLDSQALQERLETIRASGYKMNEIIEGLLLFAGLRNAEVGQRPADMNAAVRGAVERMKHALEEHGIALKVEGDLLPVRGETLWLEEVFYNLISNAVKYMGQQNPAPTITVRGSTDGHIQRYEVQDNGIGIAPEDHAKLFEMFTRFHTGEASGAGLGLSIVLRIIKKLGGEVGVESTPGQGSTFWFTLPALAAAASVYPQESEAPGAVSSATSSQPV